VLWVSLRESLDGIRYDVARADRDKAHSFTIARSELKAVQPWNLFGQIQNAAEIRTARATYHLWLLKNDADVEGIRFWNPNNTAPVAALMLAIQGKSATADSAPPSAAPLAVPAPPGTPLAASAPPDAVAAVPPGALEGIYWGWDSPNSSRARYLFFTRDGWVYRDFPDEGIAGLNLTAFRNDPKRNKSWTGRYRLEQDRINILWQDYPDDREVIHRNEDVTNPPGIPMCQPAAAPERGFRGRTTTGCPLQARTSSFSPTAPSSTTRSPTR
jgi:hypothetical protein